VRKDDGIASVILRIESPGGAVGASQEILEAVRRLAKEKPVVASMGSVATSGAYYVACGATKVLANLGTVTGSIGVRMDHVTLVDLLKWAKVNHETLKSGKFKDLGAFDRLMTPEERTLLEGVLLDMHRQFKETVAEARGIDPAEIEKLADGRIYTGRQAVELGLVDGIGGFTEAVKLAAELGHIMGEPELSYPADRGPLLRRLIEGTESLVENLLIAGAIERWQPVMALPAHGAAH
jgi:protease IV